MGGFQNVYVGFRRLGNFALDPSCQFKTLAAAKQELKTNKTMYLGQQISIYKDGQNNGNYVVIDNNGTKELFKNTSYNIYESLEAAEKDLGNLKAGNLITISGENSGVYIVVDDETVELYKKKLVKLSDSADLEEAVKKLNEVLETAVNNLEAKISELDSGLATVAKSGSYNDLKDKPVIPTKVSELENDSKYITKEDIPTKLSELENDSEFIKKSEAADSYYTKDDIDKKIADVSGTIDLDSYQKKITETNKLSSRLVDGIDDYLKTSDFNTLIAAELLKYQKKIDSENKLSVDLVSGIDDYAKKTYVDTKVAESIGSLQNKFKLVESLPSVEEADKLAIYLVKTTNSDYTGTEDLYTEFIVITNEEGNLVWEELGTTHPSFDGLATSEELTNLKTELSTNIDTAKEELSSSISAVDEKVSAIQQVEVNAEGTVAGQLSNIKVGENIYSVPEGVHIETNPEITDGTELKTLRINGTDYKLAGGTEVLANPAETGEELELKTVGIGGVNYKLAAEPEYALNETMYDYLVKQTFLKPAISTFSLVPATTVYEDGDSAVLTGIKHKETNISNIKNNELTFTGFTTKVTPSETETTVAFNETLTAGKTYTLSGIDTLGNSFSKSVTVSFYKNYYYNVSTLSTAPTVGTKLYNYTSESTGKSISYTASQYLWFFIPASLLTSSSSPKIQTNVMGQWVDVNQTDGGEVQFTQANKVVKTFHAYRTDQFSSAGSATYRILKG